VDLLIADALATKAGQYVIYALAVAGGFLIGNWLTWLLCRLVARLFFKRSMHLQLERALRILGGIVVAALVAFLLFRFGTGWGLGGSGSGEGEGTGGPTAKDANLAKDKQPPSKLDPKAKEDPATLASGLRITILRGRDYPKSYLFEGETEGVDLPTAKEKLRQRLEASEGRLKFVDIIIYRNSTAEKSALIEDLVAYAHDLGMRTGRKKLDQSLPE
jgi:hypothetical protein